MLCLHNISLLAFVFYSSVRGIGMGLTKWLGGAVGEGAGLMAVDEAMGMPISGVDDEEAGGDCELSHIHLK